MISNRASGILVTCLLVLLNIISVKSVSGQTGNSDISTLTIDLGFSMTELNFDKYSGYDIVRLEDCDYPNQPGGPMLASKVIKVAVPTGMKVTNVSVADFEQQEIPGEFTILPVQPVRRIGYDDDVEFVQPDPDIYSSADQYPSDIVELIGQSDLAGQGIAVIRVNLLRYIPVKKRLILFTSISIVIEGVDGYICGDYLSPKISESSRQDYNKMLEDMVVNPEAVSMSGSGNSPVQSGVDPGDYDYVIITSSSYVSSFQSLADWKTKKGISS